MALAWAEQNAFYPPGQIALGWAALWCAPSCSGSFGYVGRGQGPGWWGTFKS